MLETKHFASRARAPPSERTHAQHKTQEKVSRILTNINIKKMKKEKIQNVVAMVSEVLGDEDTYIEDYFSEHEIIQAVLMIYYQEDSLKAQAVNNELGNSVIIGKKVFSMIIGENASHRKMEYHPCDYEDLREDIESCIATLDVLCLMVIENL